ncbi:single-stranded-DNA-specific exonuclease [Peptoniphilus asaccharolyticus DSM 20463]|uniref:Single-stranded-DNA-specific exonuclease RecJ n=1 Tax=Peptoniphilus asaccharolyticus DSM 20463 TaxID=573058 RepID=A0A1W1UTL0_PEPAS|nr:single-stranded-DNA-specific exonuclease RecJ [Peptoniphilus asaccharolyticus]MBL7575130.1 single-stranded-DNA-specific exonuclease RecJ [Peptoniphilus asaccharolyticus]SMB84044.1 single-stranded-DNA-specific exonuclease [Peptoniphilus asaccharolyticus DSM 20463]
MEKWFIKSAKANINFDDLNLSDYMKKILSNRELSAAENVQSFLNPDISNLHSPVFLPDLIKATNIIREAINQQKKIRIVGDYDVDGVTSTFILCKGLRNLGANVDYKIPHRVEDGYGINKNIIDSAKEDGVDLIITCDNGIAAMEALEHANKLGVDVIVTDHHEVQYVDGAEQLPKAVAVINPKRSSSKYPFKGICGAVVAYKLIEQLYVITAMDEEELLNEFLPFATIGTICDVMSLVDENRALVSEGLKRLNSTSNVGLKAMIEACQIDGVLDVYHIGFIIGPTINSSGRLESAELSLELFLKTEYSEAIVIAKELRELNQKRQKLTEEGYLKVDELIQKYELDKKLRVLMVKETSIDESIIGIIAGRIKEKYNRPTLVFTKSKDFLKASGRSIDEYDMFESLQKYKDRFVAFGGHKMACGLSIEEDNLKNLIVDVNNDSTLSKEDLVKKIYIDSLLHLREINLNMIADLEILKPYGNGNPKPVFSSLNLRVFNFAVLGKNKNVLKFDVSDGNSSRKALYFKPVEEFVEEMAAQADIEQVYNMIENKNHNILIDLVYSPTINEFRGVQNIELRVSSIRISKKNI